MLLLLDRKGRTRKYSWSRNRGSKSRLTHTHT